MKKKIVKAFRKIIQTVRKLISEDYWLQSLIVDWKSLVKAVKECNYKSLF